MLRLAALVLCIVESKGWGPSGKPSHKFPPGWNGKARTPPMGWRSWNAFQNHINETTIMTAIDAFTAKSWYIDGVKASLADIGYDSIGIDEGWEACDLGINGTQHYANGTPAVNSHFPNMLKLVQYGHKQVRSQEAVDRTPACPHNH